MRLEVLSVSYNDLMKDPTAAVEAATPEHESFDVEVGPRTV